MSYSSVSRRWMATLRRTLLVVSSQHAMIKYISRGESYSTWKFYQRDSDHHRGHLIETEDAKRTGLHFVDSKIRRCLSTTFDVRRKKVKTSFSLPQIDSNGTYCDESRVWKVHKVNLRASTGEENSILSFNPIPTSHEYPNTPMLTFYIRCFILSVILDFHLSLIHFQSHSYSASLFLRFFIISFVQHLQSVVCRRKSVFRIYGNILSWVTAW